MRKKVYSLALLFFLIDFLVKLILSHVLVLGESFVVIPSFFKFQYQVNTGGAFSLFAGFSYVLAFIGVFALVYLDRYLKKIDGNLELFGFALLVGGIVGNLVDRIFYGYVIDYLAFTFFGWAFPVFNLADTFICVGVFLFLISEMRRRKNENCCE